MTASSSQLPNPGSTDRTQGHRLNDRAVHDRDAMYEILDSTVLCHVGMVFDHHPFVLPMGFARVGDELYLHGSTGARFMREMAAGAPVCVTVTLLDGMVIARSNFESSMNYRSVVVFGNPRELVGDEKATALDALSDGLVPGRVAEVRPASRKELAATMILALSLDEASVKVRTGLAEDNPDDLGKGVWAGVLPIHTVVGEPIPMDDEAAGLPIPPSIAAWVKNPKA
ncbi:MAG: pyridoxamine 5'-phosphate oxidase family protein [Actinomycetales bacterium]|nr:pyridoxamine 5'-phosphate oxidase family protein [Actinomycetales bacterium]